MCADAPLSGEAQRVSAAFEGAAAKLQESEVKLGVVDVSQEKDLAKSLNATVPPTIRLYLDGDKQKPVPCPGACKRQVVSSLQYPVMVLWFQTA